MTTSRVLLAVAVTILATSSQAAMIVSGDVTANLGPSFFIDAAAGTGGDFNISQPGTALFGRNLGPFPVGLDGTQVTITGIGWAAPNAPAANDATSVSVTITYLGLDGVFSGGDDVVFGTVTDSFVLNPLAASEYYWQFDTPLTATIDGLNSLFRIAITPTNATGDGSLRMKTTTGTTAANVKLSVAGIAIAVPEPQTALMASMLLTLCAAVAMRKQLG